MYQQSGNPFARACMCECVCGCAYVCEGFVPTCNFFTFRGYEITCNEKAFTRLYFTLQTLRVELMYTLLIS